MSGSGHFAVYYTIFRVRLSAVLTAILSAKALAAAEAQSATWLCDEVGRDFGVEGKGKVDANVSLSLRKAWASRALLI